MPQVITVVTLTEHVDGAVEAEVDTYAVHSQSTDVVDRDVSTLLAKLAKTISGKPTTSTFKAVKLARKLATFLKESPHCEFCDR